MADVGADSGGETDVLGAQDIAALNAQVVERAAAFARLAGTVLVGIGVLVGVAWAWSAYRTQDHAGGLGGLLPPIEGSPSAYDLTFAERLDLVVSGIELAALAGMAVALGLLVRLAADYTVARTGGTLTGFEVGDRP